MRFAMCHSDTEKDGELADDIADSLLRVVEDETGYELLQSSQRHSDFLILLVSDAAAESEHVMEQARAYQGSGRPILPILDGPAGLPRFKKLLGASVFLDDQHMDMEAQMMALYKRVIGMLRDAE